MRSTRFLRILGLVCAAWLGWQRTAPAAAQQPTAAPAAAAPSAAAPAPTSLAPFNDALNTQIDPNAYRLGPGDEMVISVIARNPAEWTLTVSPEGLISVPEVGTIPVLGKTPAEARQLVQRELTRYRKDFRLAMRLTRLRTIKVEVLGEVQNPGTLECGPMTRVAEAVQRAVPTGLASKHHVQIRRGGKVLPEVNLERIWRLGEEEGNVVLETGDQVFVPRARIIVNLSGEVNNAGDYEVEPGESVKELIERAGGVRSTGAETGVYVERPGPKDQRELVRADLTRNPPPVLLHDRDRIVVEPLSAVQPRIRIVGAVKGTGSNWLGDPLPKEGVQGINSGSYLLRQGDHVRDVIENVGGLTSKADLAAAKIERPDGAGGKQILPVNLRRLMVENDVSENLELRDGDTLWVPRIMDEVYVLGQVLNPGPKQYEDGLTILNYIGEAGGPTNRARKKDVLLVRGDWNDPQKSDKIPVRLDRIYDGKIDPRSLAIKPGDMIIIPETQVKSWQDVAGIVYAARTLLPGFLFLGH